MEKKVCKVCSIEKILGDYHNHPNTKDGFISTCKECVKDKQRKHYQLNKDDISYIHDNIGLHRILNESI